jgi:methionyl-tRNA synthetase
MKQKFNRTLVTAALPYANGPKHIGHLAGAYLPADIYTRYLRNTGEEVIFVCGSDEHGTAIPIQAAKEHTGPQQIIDRYHALLKQNFEKFGIAFDVYHRTSDAMHHETAQEIFLNLYEKGLFTEEESEQYYDESQKTFLADRYIKGTCPNCGFHSAFGDQCEKCGKALSPNELINPVSTLSDQTPVLKKTKHWYLPLQDYEPWLKEWLLEGHKDDWKSNTYGQSKSWIDGGLSPRAMTRDLDWGVKVPLEHAEGKVLYVWFDAPIGYISATKALFSELESGKQQFSYPENSVIKSAKKDDWKTWWQGEDTRLLHFIGKDNIVFHCIIFPAMLHATGEYILPDNVPANEFLNLEGDKMSTSRKWSVEMEDYFQTFEGREDALRYTLTAIAPETKDADFSWKDFQTRNNSELVAILGNFVNRAMVLTHKFYEGKVPAKGILTDKETELIAECKRCQTAIDDNIRHFKFREALFEMMNMARAGNKYLAETEPWKLMKTDPERTATVMHHGIQLAAHLAWWMEPFLPFTSTRLMTMLNMDKSGYQSNEFYQLAEGQQLGEAVHLYSNIEDDIIQLQIQKLMDTKTEMEAQNPAAQPTEMQEKQIAPVKLNISYDQFSAMDIRIGTILQAEKVKKADKLLQLEIDLGFEKRTVVSGIALHFTPESLIGKQVCVLANLEPRTIKGIESKGMILMAENEDGSLKLMSPGEAVVPGSTVA